MRIVVKLGTRSLLGPDDTPDKDLIESLVRQIQALRQKGIAVALVSSGAVGTGRDLWRRAGNYPQFSDEVLEKQILASLGQAALIQHYNEALAQFDMLAAQILLTRHDFRYRRHSVNIGRLMDKLLLQENLLPVINENDSLALEELMFTDNDELAGLLAAQIGADKLILLTDVPGVYDSAKQVIAELDPDTYMKDGALDLSLKGGGRGGMSSKLATARKMALIGTETYIAGAREPDILVRLMDGEKAGTFIPARRKVSPMKRWLAAGVQETRGQITINTGLAEKLKEGAHSLSILPVGISAVLSGFQKEDVVEIIDENGIKRGHGLARYDADTLESYIGKQNQPVFIHYNALHIDENNDG